MINALREWEMSARAGIIDSPIFFHVQPQSTEMARENSKSNYFAMEVCAREN
jgi:hypothetical protein